MLRLVRFQSGSDQIVDLRCHLIPIQDQSGMTVGFKNTKCWQLVFVFGFGSVSWYFSLGGFVISTYTAYKKVAADIMVLDELLINYKYTHMCVIILMLNFIFSFYIFLCVDWEAGCVFSRGWGRVRSKKSAPNAPRGVRINHGT